MKKKYIFRSPLSPEEFFKRENLNFNVNLNKNENSINVMLETGHGGNYYFYGNVSADEKGGSIVSGEITSFPFSGSNKRQPIIEKVFSIIFGIFLIPLILVIILITYIIYGIGILLDKIKGTYVREPSTEDILIDIMVNKSGCLYENDIIT